MVICGVCFTKNNLGYLRKIGVKDSKKLTSKKRNDLARLLKENCHSHIIKVIEAKEIDNRRKNRINLNRLEVLKFAEILNELQPNIILLDAADVKEERFKISIEALLNYTPKKIISKHKADDIYPIVSASSIIAKYFRDSSIEILKKKYGDFGSGYPSDEKTIIFLSEWIRKYKKPPFFARETWVTTKKLLDEIVYSKKVTDFFN